MTAFRIAFPTFVGLMLGWILVACDASPPVAQVQNPPLPKTDAIKELGSATEPALAAYGADGVLAPFSPMRRWLGSRSADGATALEGQKTPADVLRESSLDSMAYVGYLTRGRERVALLQIDGHVLTVKAGDLLGLEKARVRQVGREALDLVFQVEGPAGRSVAVLPRLMLQGQKNEK